MSNLTDAILYVPDFLSVVQYMNEHYPECLERDENGDISMPPVITGFARTPAVVNGNSLLVYARLRDHQVEQWRGTPGVEVLAEHEYVGKGTGDLVYQLLFNDPEATAKYDSVYSREPYEEDDGEGGTTTVTPPERFGVMA